MTKKKKKESSLGVFFLNKERKLRRTISIVGLCISLFVLVFVETEVVLENTQEFLEIKSLASINTIDKRNNELSDMMVVETKAVGSGQPYRNWAKNDFIADSSAIFVYDMTTGKTLLDHNAKEVLPIASLTKLISMVVVDENSSLFDDNDWLQFTLQDIEIDGHKNIFKIEEEYKLKDLQSVALVSSSNEATSLLARETGRVMMKDFVQVMQEKADSIGLLDTKLSNPIGFDGNHFSTANDVAVLLEWILENNPQLFKKSISLQKSIYSRTGREVSVSNTNYMILDEFEDIIGSKTGHTSLAKGCLAIIQKINNDFVAFVVLGAENRTTEMRSLINWTKSVYIF